MSQPIHVLKIQDFMDMAFNSGKQLGDDNCDSLWHYNNKNLKKTVVQHDLLNIETNMLNIENLDFFVENDTLFDLIVKLFSNAESLIHKSILIKGDDSTIKQLNNCCKRVINDMFEQFTVAIIIDSDDITQPNIYQHILERAKQYNFDAKNPYKLTTDPYQDRFEDTFLKKLESVDSVWSFMIIFRNIDAIPDNIRQNLNIPSDFDIIATAKKTYEWDATNYQKSLQIIQVENLKQQNIRLNMRLNPNINNPVMPHPVIHDINPNIIPVIPVSPDNKSVFFKILPILSFLIIVICNSAYIVLTLKLSNASKQKLTDKQVKNIKYIMIGLSIISVIFGIISVIFSSGLLLKIASGIIAIFNALTIIYFTWDILSNNQ